MNIVLTFKCSNHCYYCFQPEYKELKAEMHLDTLKQILDWAHINDEEPIKVLGGEPTDYLLFPEAIELINNYYPFHDKVIMTNLLGTEKNMEVVYEELAKHNFTIMVNTTTDIDKRDLMISRLKILEQINPVPISLSITFTQNNDINNSYIQHLYNLLTICPKISSIRIGAQMPVAGQKYNVFNYDQIFINFLNNLPRQLDDISLDCGLNKCLLSDKFFKYYFFQRKEIPLGCQRPTIDIFPDCSAKYCFASSEDYIVQNIFDFPNYNFLYRYFQGQNYLYQVKYSKCQQCQYYIEGLCFPCHCVDTAWRDNK